MIKFGEKNNFSIFLVHNIRIYWKTLKHSYYSYYEMIFLILIDTIQIISTNFFVYRSYSNISEQNIDIFLSSSSYLQIYNLQTIDKLIYTILFYFLNLFSILYFLNYMILLFQKKIKKNVFFRVFKLFSKYYSWIFYLPTLVINFTKFFCNELFFSRINVKCDNYNINGLLPLILAILSFICSTFVVIINGFFYSHSIYNKKDYFSTSQDYYFTIFFFRRLIFGLIFSINLKNYLLIYASFSSFFSLLLVVNFYFLYPFNKKETSNLTIFTFILFFSQNSAILINEINRSLNNNFKSSVIICFIIFSIINAISILLLFKFKNDNITFSNLKFDSNLSLNFFLKKLILQKNFFNSITSLDKMIYKGII